MKKNIWKILVQGILSLAVLGVFVGLLIYLNSSSGIIDEEVMDWKPQVAAGYSENWETVAQNDRLELLFQPSTTQLIVRDKNTGTEWRSNLADASEDAIAFGQNKTLVQSLLNIDYVNNQSNSYTMNSYQGSVQENTYTYVYQDNGVMVNWMFGNVGFEIPCFFGIDGDRFIARVLTDQIVQHGSMQIYRISLLPYFGAGSLEDEGYMVVPDGSGALINYNNQKQAYLSYFQTVYGRDSALNLQSTTLVTQDATMPVFGIRRNSDALLAVITEGEYQAEIHAEVARKLTSNNTVYSSTVFIQSENNTLLANSSNEETIIMMSPQQMPSPYYEVSYFFLEKEAGYSEMATRYQQYLVEERGMQPAVETQKDLNLTFLGGVEVRKTFLGIPYRTVEPLTPYKQLQNTVLTLQQATNGTFQISMIKLEKDGNKSKVPTKLSYESALGGESNYKRMAEALASAGIPFYPIYDPVTMSSTGRGYNTLRASRNVSRSVSPQYTYLLTSGSRDSDISPDYLISPKYVEDIVDKLLNSADKKNVDNLGLTGITGKVYSDFRKDSTSRNQTGAYWEAILQKASDSTNELLSAGAYAYAFPYVDVITDAPIFSSQYDVEDASIPFYEIVMSGYASLYSKPLNLSGNTREMLLRSIEYGVSPSFLVMTADGEALLDTDLASYYSLAYSDWEDEINDVLASFQKLGGVFGQRIVEHRQLADDLYATTYEDGTTVYVNYGEEEITAEGITVPAMGYVRKGEE